MPRPKANSNFFKTWSNDMAYILGFIVTDGCLAEHKNGYHGLNITNKNRDILKKILTIMDSNHKISVKSRGGIPKLKYFQMQIRDRTIYADLLNLGLTPRKSKIVRMPNVPSEFLGDFIRGCFDGDGSVNVWQDPRWRHAWQMRAVFCSGSYAFLGDLQKRLHEQTNLSRGSIQRATRSHVLCYSILDSVKLYSIMYHSKIDSLIYLKRKKEKFELFRRMRPDWFKQGRVSYLTFRKKDI